MKEINKKKTIITIGLITVLLCTIGATYAYFTARVEKQGDSNVNVKTEALANATMEMGNKIEASGVLPGYKTVKTVRVTGSGPENAKPINAVISLIPNVTDFSNHIEYEVYALDNPNGVNANNICSESKKHIDNNQYYDEMTCNTSNLGEKVTSGVFNKRVPVGIDIEVESNTDKTYYILVKYVNDENNPQDNEQGKRFTIDIDFGTELETGAPKYNIKASEYVTKMANISDEIVDDETKDHNLRYIGANPNNYVLFNNELWRIIGVMNDVEDENGVIEPRVKLIRDESIGSYNFSFEDNGIMKVLNEGAYYNRTKGTCETSYDTTTECDFSEIGLLDEAKEMISNIKWNFVNHKSDYNNEYYYTKKLYINEKVINEEKIGHISLMYPSDYGYATSGGETTSRESCLDRNMGSSGEYKECKENNWLNKDNLQLTFAEFEDSLMGYGIMGIIAINDDHMCYSDYIGNIYPVVFLNSNINIISGTGSSTDPFILSL